MMINKINSQSANTFSPRNTGNQNNKINFSGVVKYYKADLRSGNYLFESINEGQLLSSLPNKIAAKLKQGIESLNKLIQKEDFDVILSKTEELKDEKSKIAVIQYFEKPGQKPFVGIRTLYQPAEEIADTLPNSYILGNVPEKRDILFVPDVAI